MSELAPTATPSAEIDTSGDQSTETIMGDNDFDPEWDALKESLGGSNLDDEYLPKKKSHIAKPEHQTEPKADQQQLVKLKVNGQETEAPLSEVVKMAQKYQASEVKLEGLKAAKAQIDSQMAQVRQIGQILKSGNVDHIEKIFENFGIDFSKLALVKTKMLFDHDMLSPEQKKMVGMEKQLKQHQAHQEMLRQQEFQRVQAYHDQKASEELGIEIPKALREVDLKASPEIIARIAQVWQSALRAGKNPTATQVAQYVKGQVETERRALLQGADANKIRELLGDKANELVRSLTPKNKYVQTPSFQKTSEVKQKTGPYTKFSDWKNR